MSLRSPSRSRRGHYVMIAVADTGEGMDQATQERAFDPFFTTKGVGKGTGLGLSQVYGFARQSAGHVQDLSALGRGTTIRIYLPRHLGAVSEQKAASPVEVMRLVGDETVLLVEDEQALRAYTSEILSELGYRVFEAAHGAAALAILRQDAKIDLLLTDVVMPGGLDGRQLAVEATRLRPGVKVMFMTGYARNAGPHRERSDAEGHTISKPFAFEELARRISRAPRRGGVTLTFSFGNGDARLAVAIDHEQAAADDDRAADQDRQARRIPPDDPSHDRRPKQHRILERRQHGGRRHRQRARQADEAHHRDDAEQEQQAEIERARRHPDPWQRRRADQAGAGELPDDEMQPMLPAQLARHRLTQREHRRAEKRERRGRRQQRAGRLQRDHDADEADRDGDPAERVQPSLRAAGPTRR